MPAMDAAHTDRQTDRLHSSVDKISQSVSAIVQGTLLVLYTQPHQDLDCKFDKAALLVSVSWSLKYN